MKEEKLIRDNQILRFLSFETSVRRCHVMSKLSDIHVGRRVYCIFMKIEENTFNVIPQHRGIWYSEVSIHPSVAAPVPTMMKNQASLDL